MPLLFAGTMFVSAMLLFMVQPMVGKMVLPYVGGSPAVWNTCMVFFQALLLAGYWYAHKLTSAVGQRSQVKVHLGVLGGAMAVMALAAAVTPNGATVPIVTSLAPSGGGFPFFAVLAMLALAVGVPFFVVSTSAPLLQRWFAATGHPSAKDPYFLYAASNLGSLISLLGYPILLEPSLRVVNQTWLWTGGFAVLAFATWRCGRAAANPLLPPPAMAAATTVAPADEPTPGRKARWLLRAFVPSSLMLGVTTKLTTDIASVPLLWVIPLALYLVTFIIAFARMPWWYRPFLANAAPVVVLLLVFVLLSGVLNEREHSKEGFSPVLLYIGLTLTAYFLLSLLMHTELAHDRPSARHLTGYFLWISLGGVCGGLFNALLAPLLFDTAIEYQLAIAIGCMLVPKPEPREAEPAATEADRAKAGFAVLLDYVVPMAMAGFVALMIRASGYEWFENACKTVVEQLSLSEKTVQPFVVFAPLCLVCFLFIDRPLRFGLSVLAVLLVGEYATEPTPRRLPSGEFSSARPHRSYFGIVYVNRTMDETKRAPSVPVFEAGEAPFWQVYMRGEATNMRHGTTLHGQQFRGRFTATPYVKWPDAEGDQKHLDVAMLPTLADELRPILAFSPLEAAALVGAKDAWDPSGEPLTYYHRSGPVGQMMAEAVRRNPRPAVGMVGLGTGSAAAYAGAGQSLTFYEIDASVRDMVLAGRDFTYVNDAKKRGANIDIIMGDARLMLERDPPERKYDLLLIDAFSSDAIPVHLLTVEALKLYQSRLKPGGLFAMHISNVYLRLEPVVAAIAKRNGLACRVMYDAGRAAAGARGPQGVPMPGKTGSSWVILGDSEATLGPAFLDPDEMPGTFVRPDWRPLESLEQVKPWTDDYQDMLMVLDIRELQALRRWFGLPTLAQPEKP